jgi:3-hydroxyisobutyrate dehydrogenase-like beta-hydroxyacid dehydrogenase
VGKAAAFCVGKSNIEACEDMATLARSCQVVIVCVTDSPDVIDVARGGLFEHAVGQQLFCVPQLKVCVFVFSNQALSLVNTF